MKGKSEFTYRSAKKLQKNKKISVKYPHRYNALLKEKVKEVGLKNIQHLFDILIISGIVFRDAEIINFVKTKIPHYEELYKKERLSRLGKCERPKEMDEKLYQRIAFAYPNDIRAIKEFVIELNMKQKWLFNILLIDGFLNEESDAVSKLIEKHKKQKTHTRKKAVARLLDDEYVEVLPAEDAIKVLEAATKEYDDRKFSEDIQAFFFRLESEASSQEEGLEKELDQKIKRVQKLKTKELERLTEPVEHS